MKRSVRLRLTDMLDAIEGIEATVGEATFTAYEKNWTMRRAVERGVEIISEASRRRPELVNKSAEHGCDVRSLVAAKGPGALTAPPTGTPRSVESCGY